MSPPVDKLYRQLVPQKNTFGYQTSRVTKLAAGELPMKGNRFRLQNGFLPPRLKVTKSRPGARALYSQFSVRSLNSSGI